MVDNFCTQLKNILLVTFCLASNPSDSNIAFGPAKFFEHVFACSVKVLRDSLQIDLMLDWQVNKCLCLLYTKIINHDLC